MKLTFLITLLFVAFTARAKTASEIYEQASKSTVLVLNLDEKGGPQSRGSGVVFTKGNVVTNCHVVKDAGGLKVHSGDKEYPATLQSSDWDRDVCSLSVAGLVAPAVVIGSTKTLKVGEKVYAIGAPKGLELTLSDGIVSSLREVEGGHYIQTTAAISPGSSGGGLFDEDGALVGLTTFYLAEGQNLNFAVPVEWLNELAKRSAKASTTAQPMTQWLNKSIELESRKDWPALLEHDRRWTKAQPSSGMAWYSLGISYGKAGQIGQAIEAYKQSLRINPEVAAVWINLGIDYDETGQSAKAIETYQHALHISPEDTVWYRLGHAYSNVDQSAQSIEAYQEALRINPEFTEVWNDLGIAYKKIDQIDKAIDAYREALRINPELAESWNNLGVVYNNAGQSAQAIEAYQQALHITPKDASTWYNLGIAYSESGQRGKVLEIYKRLKTLDPGLAERFFNKVVIL